MGLPSDISGLTGWWLPGNHRRSDNTTACSGSPDTNLANWLGHAGGFRVAAGVSLYHYDAYRNGFAAAHNDPARTGYLVSAGMGWTPTSLINAAATKGTIFCVGSPGPVDAYATSWRAWYITSSATPGGYIYYDVNNAQFGAAIYDTTATYRVAFKSAPSAIGTWGCCTWMLDAGAGGMYCGWNDTRTASMGNVAAPTGIYATSLDYLYVGYSAGWYMSGYIAEIVAYNRALSEAERMDVETYLAAKYALPVAYLGSSFFVL